MKNYLIVGFIAGVMGGVIATTWQDEGRRQAQAQAQEGDRGTLLPGPPPPALGSGRVADDRRPERTILIDDTHLNNELRRGAAVVENPVSVLTPEEQVNVDVYENANRSVVNITTRSQTSEMFFRLDGPSDGAGSGSVLDLEGHILTNDHVIEGASEVRVTLFNGESFRAGLVGRDPPNDIAVLRIDAPAKMLYPLRFGDSANLRVGQKVFAIGNPFGLERTMTQGILSSVNRRLASRAGREMKAILQIDAALNQGNSGGPLLNTQGSLIGMNTAIASPSGAGENTGVGFAIPVSTIRRVVPELMEHGRVIRPVLGISHVYETERGLVIIEVARGGPADRAGLKGFQLVRERERRGAFVYERTYVDRSSADLILAVDGQSVRTGDELLDVVEKKRPGDQVAVTVLREGQRVDVSVTLGSNE